ncbi:MAG TPA: carbohydrate ABC transporter permease [Thermomicrobiales bacterium]|nr:carbohydrate ABC transporter permease [Thermomicrobiales bacterium]
MPAAQPVETVPARPGARGARLEPAAKYALLGVLAVIFLGPFYWLVVTALKGPGQNVFSYPPQLLPLPPTLQSFRDLWQVGPFHRYIFNSAVVAIAVVLGNVLFCSMAAYPLARMRFPGRDLIFYLILATLMIPFEVTLIPSFTIISKLHWVDTYQALIVPACVSPFGIFLMRQTFLTIPFELEEAARIDGANEFTIYWRIMMPLALPALATVAIFVFVAEWNSLLWPVIVLKSQEMQTLPIAITFLDSNFYGGWRQIAAGSVLSIIPILIVFLFAQRYFIAGLTTGALKG